MNFDWAGAMRGARRTAIIAALVTGCAYPTPIVWTNEDVNASTLDTDRQTCITLAEEWSAREAGPTIAGTTLGALVGAASGLAYAAKEPTISNLEGAVVFALVGAIIIGIEGYKSAHKLNVAFYQDCLVDGTPGLTRPHAVKSWEYWP